MSGLFVSACPALDRKSGGVDHDDNAEDAEEEVTRFTEAGFGDSAHVEHWLKRFVSVKF